MQQKIPIPGIDESASPPIIPATSQAGENRMLTLREKFEQIQQLVSSGYAKTRACKCLNMDIRAYEKLIYKTQEELNMQFSRNSMIAHEEKVQRKIALVDEVRELKRCGYSMREISRRTGISRSTVSRYLDDDFNPVHALYGEKRYGVLTPYMDEINRMAMQGIMSIAIFKVIQENRYTGSESNLLHYVSNWRRCRKQFDQNNDSGGSRKLFMERKNAFQPLYYPIEKVTSVSQSQFRALCDNYPCFNKIHTIVWSSKALLAARDPTQLEPWLDQAKSLGLREIDSFVEGLRRDLVAVRNAIALPYSNGLAESSVNKLKVIKRIMYGRCSFNTLKLKTLSLESIRKINKLGKEPVFA